VRAVHGYQTPVISSPAEVMGGVIMWNDPMVEEVRRIREEHAARFGYDLKAIYDDLKKREKQSSREIVTLPPKLLKEL